jgi:hypothetical protein
VGDVEKVAMQVRDRMEQQQGRSGAAERAGAQRLSLPPWEWRRWPTGSGRSTRRVMWVMALVAVTVLR